MSVIGNRSTYKFGRSFYVEWCRKIYVLRRRWNSITINWFPMYINFQQQFWFKNVQLTGVSAITKAATARLLGNTCISAIFNQSYLSIPTLPNEQPQGLYKADAWRLTKHEDKNPMGCLLENDSQVQLQPRLDFQPFWYCGWPPPNYGWITGT